MQISEEQREVLLSSDYKMPVGVGKNNKVEVFKLPGEFVEEIYDAKTHKDILAMSLWDPEEEFDTSTPAGKESLQAFLASGGAYIGLADFAEFKLTQKSFCRSVRADLDAQLACSIDV